MTAIQERNSQRLIGMVSLLFAVIVYAIVKPVFLTPAAAAIVALLGLLFWLTVRQISGNKSIFEYSGALILLTGCTLDSIQAFPDRRVMLIVMAGLIWYLFCHQLKAMNPLSAWLILTIGMTTAPFTELFQERSLWTLCSCLIGLYHLVRQGRFFTHVSKTGHLAVLLWMSFCILTLVSGFWSVYPYMSIKFSATLLFQGLVFVQVITVCSQPEQRKIFSSFLLAIVAVYVIAALESFTLRAISMGWANAMGFRINVFSRHPNYTIFPLLMTLPLWLSLMQNKSKKIITAATLGFTGVMVYLVIMSYSRQGYLLLMIYGFVLLFFAHERRMRRLVSGTMATGAILLTGALLVNGSILQRITSIFQISHSLRFNAWLVFKDLIIERPILGYGLGTNRYIYPKALGFLKPGSVSTRQFLFEAHNAYVDIVTGLGLVGLTIFCLFLLWCTFPRQQPRTLEQRIAVAVGLGIWFDLIFNFRLHALDTGPLLLVILGYCLSINIPRDPIPLIRPISPTIRITLLSQAILFCSLPWLGKHLVKTATQTLDSGKWEEIHTRFYWASLLEPLNAHPHYYMALCQQQMRSPEHALESFTNAVNLCPNYPFYRFYLATQLSEMRRHEDAMKQLEAAKNLEIYDKDGRVVFNLAILEKRLGFNQQAQDDFMVALLQNPDYINHEYWDRFPGNRNDLLSDVETYVTGFLATYNLTYQRIPLFLNAIKILENAGREDLAHRVLVSAAWNNPQQLDIVSTAVMSLLKRSPTQLTEDLLYRSLNANPDNATLNNYLGYLYLNEKQYHMAELCVRKGMESWSEISLDNYFGYQILQEIGKKTNNPSILKELEPKFRFLSGSEYQQQVGALTIHIGNTSHLVNTPVLNSPATKKKTK